MLKKILRNIDTKDISIEITNKHIDLVKEEIKKINIKRMKTMGILALIVELCIVLFLDYHKIRENNFRLIDKIYTTVHLSIFSWSAILVYLTSRFSKKPSNKIYNYLHIVNNIVVMLLISMIAVLDQMTIGNITVYISIFLTCGALVLTAFPYNVLTYTIPHMFFLFLLQKYSETSELFIANTVNSSVFYLSVLVFTKMLYKNQVNQIGKNILLEEINMKILQLSNYDSLTGLANRRYFEELVCKDIEDNCILKNESIVAIMDVDLFKNINDKHGHYVGDLVLKSVAKVINKTIGNNNLIARWGGEEFIFFFQGMTMEEVDVKLNKLRKNIEKNVVKIDNKELRITASFGYAKIAGNTREEFDDAFKLADKALYRAKAIGRNCVVMN